jgi:DNA-binding HxlR family transcriptional regulator
MKTDTGKKIFEFIKEKGQVPAKEIINFVGFSAPAVFRQLKKLQEKKMIQKTGFPPRVFYHLPMTDMERQIHQVVKWVCDEEMNIIDSQNFYCPTRDVFQSKNEHILKILLDNNIDESLSYLLVAAVGEVGNNSFDHNFGNWPNIPGVYFKVDIEKRLIILADRGQGVFATLRKVRSEIQNDEEALRVAFTDIVSGRSPEQRGNGLKFVKKVFLENNLKLQFYSGKGLGIIENRNILFKTVEKNILGTITIIEF